MRTVVFIAAALSMAVAQDEAGPDYKLRLGAQFWKATVKSNSLRSDSQGLDGNDIVPDKDLHTDDNDDVWGAAFEGRLTVESAVLISAESSTIRGDATLSRPMAYSGINSYFTGHEVVTTIESANISASYEYDIYSLYRANAMFNFGLTVGAGYSSYSAKLDDTTFSISAQERRQWTYPLLGVHISGAFADRFMLDIYTRTFSLDSYRDSQIHFLDSGIQAGINTIYGIWLFVGYRALSVDIDDGSKDNERFIVDYDIRGAFVSVEFHF